MTPDVADLQARVAYLSDELARAKAALASPGCGEACPVAARERASHLDTRKELSMALAQRHVLVEAAVRATIAACMDAASSGLGGGRVTAVQRVDPAPIVSRVLGGGE